MTDSSAERHEKAVREFNQHEHRKDGSKVVDSLWAGLTLMSDSLYVRVHSDVEKLVGKDSMLMPISEIKSETQARTEIELYQVAESAAAVQEHGYVGADDDWYPNWLLELRLDEWLRRAAEPDRLAGYLAQSADDRRLAFTDVLARVLPESREAPLVLFRLAPLSVRIVTSLAFGDHARALEARQSQKAILPAIGDCQQCNARMLDNGEKCDACGNPLWNFDWLTAID